MKKTDELQQLWNRHEQMLRQQWQINAGLLRKINLGRVERKMRGLVWIKAIALGFYFIIAFLLIAYIAGKWPSAAFVVSGSLIALWAVSVIITSMLELKMLLRLDYSEPVCELQKHLLELRSSIIKYLRLGAWVFPLYMAFVVLFFDLFFGTDIIRDGNRTWLVTQILISVFVMLPLAVWMHKKLDPENAGKKWMYTLLRRNGAQISEAVELLREIREMEEDGEEAV